MTTDAFWEALELVPGTNAAKCRDAISEALLTPSYDLEPGWMVSAQQYVAC